MLREELSPEEAAEVALGAADEAVYRALDRLCQEARDSALAAILGDGQYRVGAVMARRMDLGEDAILRLVSKSSELNEHDSYMAWEDAFGFELRVRPGFLESREA